MHGSHHNIQVPECRTFVFADVIYSVQCFFFDILHTFTHYAMRTPTASKYLKVSVLLLHQNSQGRKLHVFQ